jgi:hypothetical protein
VRPTFDFDRQASAWLADGPTELADRVLDAALREVHLTKQRHRFSMPWRTPLMSSSMRAAAAIGIVTIVGLGLVAFNSGTPGVGSGTPSPTASPTAVPSDSPSPAATVAPSPTQPPVSFTSPLYGYTVSWPSGGGWNVTPATVPWPEQTSLTDGY